MTISFSRYLTVDLYLQKWEENKRRDMTRHAGAALAGLRSRDQLVSFKASISCNSLLTDWRSIYRSHLWPDDLVAVLLSHVSVRCSPTRLGHLDSGHCELASFRIIFLFFFVNSYINSPIMLVFCLVAGIYMCQSVIFMNLFRTGEMMLLFLSTNHSLFGNRVWSLCLWSSSSPRLSSSTEKAMGREKHYWN